jgi:hypothetical protein
LHGAAQAFAGELTRLAIVCSHRYLLVSGCNILNRKIPIDAGSWRLHRKSHGTSRLEVAWDLKRERCSGAAREL